MNTEFLNDAFNSYFEKGIAAKNAGNIQEAKRQLMLAAETLKKIVAESTGELKLSRQKRVLSILETIEALDGKKVISSAKNDANGENETTPKFNIIEPSGNSSVPAMEELNRLVGLATVKESIDELKKLAEYNLERKKRGISGSSSMSLHLVFTGNPGTGKTTVARIIGQLYKEIGLLERGHLVETDRGALVGGYVGHTAPLVKKAVEAAMGGVLFIDEAYTLSEKSENDFGKEAINTLLKEMEDKRDKFVLIVAGYTKPMEGFIASNPGLKSRFNTYIEFDDYKDAELSEIFGKIVAEKYTITDDAMELVANHFAEVYKQRQGDFANARGARNLYEKIIVKQAKRLSSMLERADDNELVTITTQDVQAVIGK
ncbi:MAG: AAA family ATPase [Firmicutes bacterium]|nr:AAA family ATPase [Bacillota bacterium]